MADNAAPQGGAPSPSPTSSATGSRRSPTPQGISSNLSADTVSTMARRASMGDKKAVDQIAALEQRLLGDESDKALAEQKKLANAEREKARRRRQSYFQTGGKKRTPVTAAAAAAVAEATAAAAAQAPPEEAPPAETDTWDSVSRRPECVICGQVFTSIAKLKQHEQFSTLHEGNVRRIAKENARAKGEEVDENSIAGGEGNPELDGSPGSSLIYQGSKLFWRTNTRIDLHIYEEDAPEADPPSMEDRPDNAVQRALAATTAKRDHLIITIVPFNLETNTEMPHIYVSNKLVEAELDWEAIERVEDPSGERKYFSAAEQEAMKSSNRRSALATFLISRLALDGPEPPFRRLLLTKLTGDEYVTLEVVPPKGWKPEKVKRRRRSSMAEFVVATQGLHQETEALGLARRRAERLAIVTRLSVTAFGKAAALHAKKGKLNKSRNLWLNKSNQVMNQAQVERAKRMLSTMDVKEPGPVPVEQEWVDKFYSKADELSQQQQQQS